MDHLYPAGPASVPPDLARPTRSYKLQAWLAGAGLTLFILLYAALAGWFVWTAWRVLGAALAGGEDRLMAVVVGLSSAFLAIFMLKAVVFVRRGSAGDDLEITAADQPELFAFLHRLADDTGAPRAHRVFLSGDVNAAVFYDLSIINLIFPSKKNLVIGLPLVNVLTLGELKAVLAHEFGHFAQRSMAIGIWVYIAHQIAGHVIARRDALDRFLAWLSTFDLRVAWVGWTLRLVVWSIRSLLDTLLTLMLLAQRALSREMELQADLVAVTVTGSDQLVHALRKLQAADESWSRTCDIAAAEARAGRKVRDAFDLHRKVMDRTRIILGDAQYGRVPPLPAGNAENHRVFTAGLGRPPQMWSTHPESTDRENNAKKRYIPVPLDERSAWELFRHADALREKVCAAMFPPQAATGGPAAAVAEPLPADLLGAMERQFNRAYLRPYYRGAYLGRSPARHAARVVDLYADMPPSATSNTAALVQQLAGLYPASLAGDLARLRQLEEERNALHGLWRGTLRTPDGVVRFRGNEVSRRQLPELVEQVGREADAVRDGILQHDRRCRSIHLSAARRLGQGWPEYLRALAAIMHYADHAEADLRDARGLLENVYAVVTADGKVSGRELKRLLRAANELHAVLARVFGDAPYVRPDASLREKLGIESWPKALGEFTLPPATGDNAGDWLGAIDEWVEAVAGELSALKYAALEQLLVSETLVANAARKGAIGQPAPPPSSCPAEYPVLLPGEGRARQTQLDWWDRFQTADGLPAATLRLAIAATIVGAVLVLAGRFGSATVHVYNGLGSDVLVRIGDSEQRVAPADAAVMKVPHDEAFTVEARTPAGGLIESFVADTGGDRIRAIYNVAGASPLVRWSAVYGNAEEVPEEPLGQPRWTTVEADVFFREPPAEVKTKDGGAVRTVLSGVAEEEPSAVLSLVKDADEQLRIAMLHARWDTPDSPHALAWMELAAEHAAFPAVIAARLQDDPADPLALHYRNAGGP